MSWDCSGVTKTKGVKYECLGDLERVPPEFPDNQDLSQESHVKETFHVNVYVYWFGKCVNVKIENLFLYMN